MYLTVSEMTECMKVSAQTKGNRLPVKRKIMCED